MTASKPSWAAGNRHECLAGPPEIRSQRVSFNAVQDQVAVNISGTLIGKPAERAP